MWVVTCSCYLSLQLYNVTTFILKHIWKCNYSLMCVHWQEKVPMGMANQNCSTDCTTVSMCQWISWWLLSSSCKSLWVRSAPLSLFSFHSPFCPLIHLRGPTAKHPFYDCRGDGWGEGWRCGTQITQMAPMCILVFVWVYKKKEGQHWGQRVKGKKKAALFLLTFDYIFHLVIFDNIHRAKT